MRQGSPLQPSPLICFEGTPCLVSVIIVSRITIFFYLNRIFFFNNISISSAIIAVIKGEVILALLGGVNYF